HGCDGPDENFRSALKVRFLRRVRKIVLVSQHRTIRLGLRPDRSDQWRRTRESQAGRGPIAWHRRSETRATFPGIEDRFAPTHLECPGATAPAVREAESARDPEYQANSGR